MFLFQAILVYRPNAKPPIKQAAIAPINVINPLTELAPGALFTPPLPEEPVPSPPARKKVVVAVAVAVSVSLDPVEIGTELVELLSDVAE